MTHCLRIWCYLAASIAFVATGLAASGPQADFFVAANGNDRNPGTELKPFATLERARDAVREIKAGHKGPITILIRGGKYYLSKPLVLGHEDSGTRYAPVLYASYPGEIPVLSGGERVSRWMP